MTQKTHGTGQAHAHHGEILQGVFDDTCFQRYRGLVTFPCRHLQTHAIFVPNSSHAVTISPGTKEKARRAAALTLRQISRQDQGGNVEISSTIPIGRGMGSSTADVLATIQAILDRFDVAWSMEEIMHVAVEAETACDSTLFSQVAVLFAQRDGIVLEAFDRALPKIDIISVDCEPSATVSTLDFEPALYNEFEVEAFKPLRSLLRRAVRQGDAGLVGKVATASARINQRFLAKPRLDELEKIAAASGAIGLQVAHSGTLVGMMFDHLSPHRDVSIERATASLEQAKFSSTTFPA